MLPGLLTPTHVLFLLDHRGDHVRSPEDHDAADAARPSGARDAASRGPARFRRLRLRKPTRREAHIGWLVICVVLAFVLTRAVAMPLFLLVFVAVWACGYGVLARLYR